VLSRRMRTALASVAAVALVALGSAPVALADQTEVCMTVLTHGGWIDTAGLHMIGEVRNTSSSRVNGYVTFRVQSGAAEDAFAGDVGIMNLAPGGRSPLRLDEPYNHASATLIEITYCGYVQSSPVGAIGVSPSGPLVSDASGDSVPVQIRNGTPRAVHIFRAIAAFRRSDGQVSNMGTGLQDVVLNPGESVEGTVFAEPSPDVAVRADVDVVAAFEGSTWEAVVSWQNWFQDIADQSLRMSIAWLAEHGITGGCSTFKYCPTANVTRAQMAIFLVRAFGFPPATGPDHFSDDNGKTGESSINALFEAGITGGCNPGLFCPTANVTRAQMAIFLVRALGLPAPSGDHFSDDNGMTGESQINSLYEAGVTGGCAPGKFCPTSPVTRAQMAAFLQRALALP